MQPNIFQQQVPDIFASTTVDIFSEEQPSIFDSEEDTSIFPNTPQYAWEDCDESNENESIADLLQDLEHIANQLKQDPNYGVLGDLIINALLLTNV